MSQRLNHFIPWRRERPLIVLAIAAALAVVTHELARRPMHWHHSNKPGSSPAKPLPVPVPPLFTQWRNNFITLNRAHDPLGLVRGIFLGDDSSIEPPVRNLFRNAGLSHLLAASGFNCWIVALVFGIVATLVLHACIPFLPSLWALAARKWVGPLSSLGGAWMFWLWTDQSSPITRSALMISLKFIFDLLGLRSQFSRALLVQYLVSLAVLPRLWHSASFQLTFGCLFGIIYFPPAIEKFKPTGALAGKIWDYLVVGLGACLGTIPTTWAVFGEINFTSLLTNWFAIPPVSFVIMPLGLAEMALTIPINAVNGEAIRGFALWLAHLNGCAAGLLNKALELWMSVMPSLRYY